MKAACGPYISEWITSAPTTPRVSSARLPSATSGKNRNGQTPAATAAPPYSSRRLTRSESAPASGMSTICSEEPISTAVSAEPRDMSSSPVA